MRWEVTLFAVGLLLASFPAGAAPGPSTSSFLRHDPINITNDTGFSAANGVVSGTGAPGDPYVISGWNIATSGTAIRIYNVTASFVIRDDLIDAGYGITVTQARGGGIIANNQIIVHSEGIIIGAADITVQDNSLIASDTGEGILLQSGNSLVQGNAINRVRVGIHAERGSPSILCNDVHLSADTSIYVRYATSANVSCNTITDCHAGINIRESTLVNITANLVTTCDLGVQIWADKDMCLANNTIRYSSQIGVWFESSTGCVTSNIVIDGKGDGMQIWHSPLLMVNNTVSNNLAIGMHFAYASADVIGNVATKNGIGIALNGGDIVHLDSNVMANNTVGLSIPYEARQSITNMTGNMVNGVNVDGTIDASQKVFFYKEANVTISGQVRDSGFSAGYYGSISGEGGVVLYEVETANINATLIAHHNVGIGIVNSFNVNVNGSEMFDDLVGVYAESEDPGAHPPPLYGSASEYDILPGGAQVPDCSVSIKNSTIHLPHDPTATIGVDLDGCVGIVGNVSVSFMATGVKVDGSSAIKLFNSTVTDASIGLDIMGIHGAVNLTGNTLTGDTVGARLSNTVGIVVNNTFLGNAKVGLQLASGSNITLTRNNFTENGEGIVDSMACTGGLTCSSVNARANTFIDNAKDGAHVNGATWWNGDIALGNGDEGFELTSNVVMRHVYVSGSATDGAKIAGTFDISDSTFTQNGANGADLVGGGVLRDSTFTFNTQAGIAIAPTFMSGEGLNVSSNFDGILATQSGSTAGVPTNVPGVLALASGTGAPDQMDIHVSQFLHNRRDAVRAGNIAVNATHDYWGTPNGPAVDVLDTVGAFQNGVSPAVRFLPWFTDDQMTTTGPVAGL